MMKKLFALSLALVMLFSLCACSSESADGDRESQTSSSPDGTLPSNLFGSTTTTATETEKTEEETEVEQTTTQAVDTTTAKAPTTTQKVETTTAKKPTTTAKVTTTTKKPTTTTTKKVTTTTTKKPTTTTTKKPTTTTTKKPTTTTTTLAQNVYLRNNNNYITQGEISINPRYVYWRNGNLVAECYVINGTSSTITRLKVNELTFYVYGTSRVIASADFGEVNINPIGRNQYQIVTFTFGTNDVRLNNANITSLDWWYDLQFI